MRQYNRTTKSPNLAIGQVWLDPKHYGRTLTIVDFYLDSCGVPYVICAAYNPKTNRLTHTRILARRMAFLPKTIWQEHRNRFIDVNDGYIYLERKHHG
jgi:hypothetical protein